MDLAPLREVGALKHVMLHLLKFDKNTKQWYKKDALGAIFAICKFDSFDTS